MQQGNLISFRQLKDKLASTTSSTAFAKLYILLCICELLAPENSDKVSLKYGASEGRVRIDQDVQLVAACARHHPCRFRRVACYSKSVSVGRHQFPHSK
ncbi:hypothetical protein LINGRAHAP2_LOCUS5078 [Linum grandiflorum]